MQQSFLSFGLTFSDLYDHSALLKLDRFFLAYLQDKYPPLAILLKKARSHPPSGLQESKLLLDIAPYLEDFLGTLFKIEGEIQTLQNNTYQLAPIYRCKRLFIQRQVAKLYTKEDTDALNEAQLKEKLEEYMGEDYSDLTFANHVLNALNDNPQSDIFLEIALKYAACRLYDESPSILFTLPRKTDPDNLFPIHKNGQTLNSCHNVHREGFDCTDPGVSQERALDQASYCILCHNQGKDSCSKGLTDKLKGCPLDQKISEMNTLRVQGYVLGALATIMIDNPLVAATGHRICNDCMRGCIFQKQEAVNIPSIETQTLESVLNLPWGVEIYSLLSRWNPLNLKRPLPSPITGYKVLVAGLGPAGFTLAHYLLNEGHCVVGIDGLKIEPLPPDLFEKPIRSWQSLKEPLSDRIPEGFGGVMEYGITVRWEKNYLKLVRLLLERRSHFAFYDGVRLGGTITMEQAFELGFDHVALCLGAGRPNALEHSNGLARGVRLASDFLMALQSSGAAQEKSLANLQIRLPILIIGGGLTAVDTATEALAYYPIQVEKYLKRKEILKELRPTLNDEESEIEGEFLAHAQAFRKGDRSILEQASTIVYRNRLQNSPAYHLNAEELNLALQQGVTFLENATPLEVKVDQYGHIESLVVTTQNGLQTLPCRSLFVAIGTHPNTVLEREDPHLSMESKDILLSYKGENKVSFFGDLHPTYNGNVVKAMASAKDGFTKVCETLSQRSPSPSPFFIKQLDEILRPRVHKISRLTPSILEIIIKAPQAALNFKAGQFFRLQTYGPISIEGLALTGAHADPKTGLLSLIILEMGASSKLCQFIKVGERISLMGPTGTPTEIPKGETVLLIGGGLGNAVLFSIGRALKEKGNRVLYVAGYKSSQDRFKVDEIEAVSDHVIWCCESPSELKPNRLQDFSYVGNVLEGLLAYANSSPPLSLMDVKRIITIGSDRMMAAVACARKTILKPYLNPNHYAIGSINSPMQCMMKEICGQCIQTHINPTTGKTKIIFSCSNQDQLLDEVNFDVLQQRLKQNSLLEKQTDLWIQKLYGV
ncbi:MAG: FAD-dependent oxidoreductase [Alphaproteobacteria bacterium]|nr:FAD-dependent oxidoreductase [Alphaproteobacteria bacterium]